MIYFVPCILLCLLKGVRRYIQLYNTVEWFIKPNPAKNQPNPEKNTLSHLIQTLTGCPIFQYPDAFCAATARLVANHLQSMLHASPLLKFWNICHCVVEDSQVGMKHAY